MDLWNCKWSKQDDVVVSTQLNNVYVYPYPATGGVGGFTSKLSASGTFTDLAVRPDTATPIKVLVTGGNSAQNSGYFFNSGGTQTSTPNTFSNTTPTAAINTVCYGGDAIEYAVGGADKRMWIFDDATDSVTHEFPTLASINDCDFSIDG